MADEKTAEAQGTPNADANKENVSKAPEGGGQAAAAAETKPPEGDKAQAETKVEETNAKTGDDKSKAPAAPEKYELKLPEGSQLKAEDVSRIEAHAKARGLSNEQAQAVLEFESLSTPERHQQAQEQLKAQSETWKQEFIADKTFGGEQAAANAELAHRVAKRFGDEGFAEELDRSGFGNHPGLTRLLARVGKAMSNDQLVHPNSSGAGVKKSMEEKFYGSNK